MSKSFKSVIDWEEIYRDWLYSVKSVECIAKERNLDPSTVHSHITIRLRKGKSQYKSN